MWPDYWTSDLHKGRAATQTQQSDEISESRTLDLFERINRED